MPEHMPEHMSEHMSKHMSIHTLPVLDSPQHLKLRHGGGYRIELKAKEESAAQLTELINNTFDGH